MPQSQSAQSCTLHGLHAVLTYCANGSSWKDFQALGRLKSPANNVIILACLFPALCDAVQAVICFLPEQFTHIAAQQGSQRQHMQERCAGCTENMFAARDSLTEMTAGRAGGAMLTD